MAEYGSKTENIKKISLCEERELTTFDLARVRSNYQLAWNSYRPDAQLKLTANAFNRHKPVRQQSW